MQFDTPDFTVLSLAEVKDYFTLEERPAFLSLVEQSKKALDEQGGILPSGLAVMSVLRQLGMDEASCIAALLSDSRMCEIFTGEVIADQYGDTVAELVKSVRWLHSFSYADQFCMSVPEQAESIRRLVLQASTDVRAILIKLAYRVERMRKLAQEPDLQRQRLAQETLDIYAPLANRLGLGQLKWELEDFSFRFLEPHSYKQIANNLEERRQDREKYLQNFVSSLSEMLESEGLVAQVAGRPKHIYSIAKKMRSKGVGFDELFDVRAVRVIVQNLAQCYAVLGFVHGRWPHVATEFDDYIAKPKPNGYQSLHSVIIGPEKKAVEVQIRTQGMHELAESGVAAHWRYKEAELKSDEYLQGSIALLRKTLEVGASDEELLSQFSSAQENSRVYVFTPKGEVVDLPSGATALDFAYSIHTEVGHRCRGAKVNGRIVPLNTRLQDADRLEIITAKEAAPTREWFNEKLGYVHSSHVRAKIRGWFNKLDYHQHVEDGGYIFERELNRYNGRGISDADYAAHFGASSVEEMLAAIGRNNINSKQILSAISQLKKPIEKPLLQGRRRQAPESGDIQVLGVGNLLCHSAACCQPLRGDAIIGFITRGRGVSVHRQNCRNIKNLSVDEVERLIPVQWGAEPCETAEAQLYLQAFDREGLLRDITAALSKEQVHLNAINTRSDREQQTAIMDLTLELKDVEQLSLVVDRLAQIPNVYEVRRKAQ